MLLAVEQNTLPAEIVFVDPLDKLLLLKYFAGKLIGHDDCTLYGAFKVVKLVQPVNISVTLVTFVMSKLLKSNEVRDEQLSNIRFIYVTLLVSKFVPNVKLVKDEQL